MKTGIIYIATNIVNNKSYIGQTINDLGKRICIHYQCSKTYDYHFARALRKYNKICWQWRMLYNNVPIEQLNNMEKWCIANYDTYNNGYNSTFGGEDNPMNNEETRRKVSKSKTGKKLTKEHCKKISEGNKGKIYSEEVRCKISIIKRGKKRLPFSEEHRKNMSNSLKGKTHSQEHIIKQAESQSKTWKVIKPDGNMEIIKNLANYCRENNLNRGAMIAVSNGTRNHHKGYKVVKLGGNE